MSFLTAALGAVATPLLKAGGGWLMDRIRPLISRIGGWFGGKAKGVAGNIGQTASQHVLQAGRSAMDGIRSWAKGDYLNRKSPMLANAIGGAAGVLRDRLQTGHDNMAAGGTPGGGAAQ